MSAKTKVTVTAPVSSQEQGDQMHLLKIAQNVAQSSFLSKIIHNFYHEKNVAQNGGIFLYFSKKPDH
jgi:hypothetical protein